MLERLCTTQGTTCKSKLNRQAIEASDRYEPQKRAKAICEPETSQRNCGKVSVVGKVVGTEKRRRAE